MATNRTNSANPFSVEFVAIIISQKLTIVITEDRGIPIA
ncbi:MAG: hypothetical protein H6Q07_2682 [Acidobacteria bacterium]|jgi:hypothetical protein|nr:hypothetical protein [Acidobacteriota bacterium]